MKLKMKFFKIIIIVVLFITCTETNTSPAINSIILTSTNIQIEEGAFLEIIYDFSDDVGLNKFRVTVLDNCENARLKSAPWYIDNLDFDISGTSLIDTLQIPIPYEDIEPCEYELTVIVQDIDGNETAQSNTFFVVI